MVHVLTPETVRIGDGSDYLGETPVWSDAEQCLYWVNVEQPFSIHRWSVGQQIRDTWPMPKRVGGIALKERGGLIVVLADGLYDFDPARAGLSLRVASPLPSYVKLHECTTDRQGRLWVGAYDHRFSPESRQPAGGAYFRLDGDQLTPVIDKISIANGLAFSADSRVLYAADSATRSVDVYDFEPVSGAVSGQRRYLEISPNDGFLDGATVDAEGGYWLSMMYGGVVHRYRLDGTLDCVLKLPFSSPTKAVFGGEDFGTMFITTTRMRLGSTTPPGFAENGPVYSCRPGFRGVADLPVRD